MAASDARAAHWRRRDWLTINLDGAVETNVIHTVSNTLMAHGIRREAIVPPLVAPGAITPGEACAAASLLAGQQPGSVARLGATSVGHLPQDMISHVATAMKRVSSGVDSIPAAAPTISFGQGNLRVHNSSDIECHAIVVAFSIERTGA